MGFEQLFSCCHGMQQPVQETVSHLSAASRSALLSMVMMWTDVDVDALSLFRLARIRLMKRQLCPKRVILNFIFNFISISL